MTPIDSFSRRFFLLLAGATLALSACSGDGGETSTTNTSGADGKYTVACMRLLASERLSRHQVQIY